MAAYVGVVPKDKAVALWKQASAVCFDVDRTAKAMGGNVTFQESLSARLTIMKPTLTQVEQKVASEPPSLTPGIAELVALLLASNKKVYLVSGGFHRMILPVATVLNINPANIYANKLQFDDAGNYSSFDDTCYTSRTGGKTEVVAHLKTLEGHASVVMIGDGATDMEARPPADLFIGFGGNKIREKVQLGADWFVTDFNDLITPLK